MRLSCFYDSLSNACVYFLGFTKILVGTGSNSSGQYTNKFEIVDLEGTSSKCKLMPVYPFPVGYSAAAFGLNEKPTVCGGFDGSKQKSECYTLDSTWQKLTDMYQALADAQLTLSPFVNKSDHLVLSGGNDGSVAYDGVGVFNGKTWESLASLPKMVSLHCMLLINSTTLMAIGGISSTYLNDTYYFHSFASMPSWISGPSLRSRRYEHSCARIRFNLI